MQNNLRPIEVAKNAPNVDIQDNFRLDTLVVPIWEVILETWKRISDCRIEVQIIWNNNTNLPLSIISPALTWWARIYAPWTSSQWWWWWNAMVWKWKTFDPTISNYVCFSHIWWAEWSTWPHHFWNEFPIVSINDIARVNLTALLRLSKEKRIFNIIKHWINAVIWPSFGWSVAISMTNELIRKDIEVRKLIPIESTSNPTAFVLATWEIYKELLETIPNALMWCRPKERDLEVGKWINLAIDGMRRLLSIVPSELSEFYRNEPDLWISFSRWQLIPRIRWRYLDDDWNENYKEAFRYIIDQLNDFWQKNWNKPYDDEFDTLLWIARQFWFLLFLSPIYFKEKLSLDPKSDRYVRSWLKRQYNEFVKRFSLEALRILIKARDMFETSPEMAKNIIQAWVKTFFIANDLDTYYDLDSIKYWAKILNADVFVFSHKYWHDWAFSKEEHIRWTTLNPTLFDNFNEALAA